MRIVQCGLTMELKDIGARNAMAWELVKLYGAEGARARCSGQMLAAVEAEIAQSRPERHCQNGRTDICLAGWQDGICCPDDSCDIDDGLRYKATNGE